MDIVKEKIAQAPGILNELDRDLWLIFVRETPVLADPLLPLVVGFDATWPSFFCYTRKGDAIAIVGNLDAADYERSGRFTEVVGYTGSVKEDFLKIIKRLDPKDISINFSLHDPSADGLTHGMYLQLCEYLAGTPYANRLLPAENLCAKLRSRKTPTEIARLTRVAEIATEVWDEAIVDIELGMTEIEVGRLIDGLIARRGGTPSFETIVNAGDKTKPGHGHPTEARLERGDLLHIDFGVKLDDYCSDIQRLLYFKHKQEAEPPVTLMDAFETVSSIITTTGEHARPGVRGFEIDGLAREMLRDNGYDEYQHALGHQLGRAVHDGGACIGPRWETYGVTTSMPLEKNNVFTLELEINLPGIGCVGLEEDVVIEETGARFISPRQRELIVK